MEPETETNTKTLRILISSPGDVKAERDKAKQVISQLQNWYGPAVNLVPVLWEELPLEINASFQDGIDVILSGDNGIDIAVFILWSRIGTPVTIGDKTYNSGTEREFDLMLHALEASGGKRPDVLFYRRNDDDGFTVKLSDPENKHQLEKLIEQRNLAKAFLQENFWDEHGQNIRAYHSFHQPVEFAGRLKVHLQGLIDARLEDSGLKREARWADVPYRGLEAFNLEHADIFFGREREIVELESRLRQRENEEQPCAFVAVIGASGSGKSSLVRAGLRANLTRFNLDESISEWRSMVMMPGQAEGNPIRHLLENLIQPGALPELGQGGLSPDELAENFAESPRTTINLTIKPLLKGVSEKSRPKLLVIVDQFEEIFTDKRISADDREAFLLTLEALAQSGICWVVVTMRSDFFPTAQKNQTFLRLKGETGHFDLLAPGMEALQRIITEPARMAGVRFEKRSGEQGGQSLAGKILEDARNQSDLLPLLSDLLLELYNHKTKDNLIPFAAYDAYAKDDRNGLEGVLSVRAEKVFASLGEKEQATCPGILHALVTVEGESDVRRRASLDALRDTPEKARLVDALIKARLLTADGDGHGATVSLAHEALLRKWDRVAAWVTENRQHLRIRSRVEQLMRRWKDKKEIPDLLLPKGLELEEARSLLRDAPHLIAGEEYQGVRHYIQRSTTHHAELDRRARKRRRFVTAALSVLALGAMAGAAYGWVQTGKAVVERDKAWLQEGKAWMLRASVAEQRGKRYPDTLLYAAQAIGFDGVGRSGDAAEPRRFIPKDLYPADYQAARDWISNHPAYLPLWSSELRADAPATAMAVDPSGKWLALGSAAGVRLLDMAGQKEQTIPGITGITDLDFDPSGKTLAIAGSYRVQSPTVQGTVKNQVRIWDLEKSTWGPVLDGQAASLAWSPGGDWLAGAAPDGSILLWKNGRANPEVIKDKLPKAAISLTFSPEDAFLAAIEPGAGPRLFFPDHLAAAASWQGLVHSKAEGLAELEKAEFLSRVDLAEAATCVAVDPKGKFLATGTRDGNVVLWDAEKLTAEARVSPEQRHLDEKANPVRVAAVAFRPDGKQIASAAEDGTIKLWEVRSKSVAVVATLTGHIGPVTAVTYAPGGRLLASAGADGSARLWDVHGELAATPDLLTYVTQRWYTLEPEAAWVAGKDFANLLPAELGGCWRGSETRNLADEAKAAAKEKRWRFVDLLQRQVATLPVEVSKALAEAQLKTEAKLGASFTNGNNMDLLWCPKGTFTMGSPETEEGRRANEDLHKVTFTTGFWLAKTEVTQKEWTDVMGRNPSSRKGDTNPVEMVNWEEATEFCRRLTDRERARGTLPRGMIYALPTDAQWEYACRAGAEPPTAWSFGNDPAELHKFGNYNDKTGNFAGNDTEHDDKQEYSAPVKTYPANRWGFHDMHGNVWEWCQDVYEQNLGSQPVTDPTGPPSGSFRVFRGGSFSNSAAYCRSAFRYWVTPENRNGNVGFRVAAVPDPSSPGVR